MSTCPIPQETLSQLCIVLKNLGLSDNQARDQAEQQLNSVWLQTRPDELLLGLVHVARTTEDQVLRAFAPVLLRRLAFKPLPNRPKDQTATPWDVIQTQTRAMVKNDLLVALSVEQDKSVRHKLCDCISEISKSEMLRGEQWPEILPALFECSRSPSEGHREAAFRIFAASPDVISEQHVDGLKTVFVGALQDSSIEVRLAALKAAAAFMLDTDPNSRNSFNELISQMFAVVIACYQNRDEDSVTDSIGVLIELAEHVPKTFKVILNHLVELMIQIMSDKLFQDTTRQSSLELLLTLTESASPMMRKQQGFAERVIPIALQMMTDIDDEPTWYTGDDSDEDDNEENWAVGEQAMDRLARFLGGKRVVPVAFQYIPGMLGAEQWQQRHAALMAISAIGEGCVKVMTAELGKILDMILPYLRDPHTRVRYAACNAVGQMSTDFGPILQNNFHQTILSALVPVMDDTANPRVQSHAAAALVNFCEGCDKNVITPYLDAIFERLLILLNTSRTYVQEQAITTIATVADSAEDRFGKYYSSIMPLLMNVLRSAASKEYRMLRGKAMECATLIALAVGKNTFGPDAAEFITLLRQTQESVTEADDPQISFLLSAWARICKVLGQDFVQYLEVVMPPLLKSAQMKPEFAVLDPDDDDNESKYSVDEGWEFVGIDGQQIGIKTTILEEKCTAVELLGCYAKELGAAFHTYAPQVLEILLPLLRFYFHDGVREAAAVCLPRLLTSVKKASYPPEQIHRMWSAIVDRTVEVLNTEADLAFLMSFYSSFSDCIDVLGANCLNAEQLGKLTEGLKSQLQDHYERLKQRHEERTAAGEEFDEDDEVWKESEETDEDVLQELSRVVHTIFKTHGAAYLPHFEGMLPITDAFLVFPNFAAKQWAVCVLDDMVEFTGAESWRYHGHFVNQLIECVVSEHEEVRQAACYGVGVFGQFGGETFADACAAALPNLFAVINSHNAKDEKNILVTDNAVSAVGKICKYNSSKFDVSAVLPTWFAALPIVNDEEEAAHVYEYLLELLDAQHPSILGANHENIPHLVQIFTTILVSAILPESLATRVVGSLKAVLNGCTEEMKQQLWGGIAAEDRRSLAQMGYI